MQNLAVLSIPNSSILSLPTQSTGSPIEICSIDSAPSPSRHTFSSDPDLEIQSIPSSSVIASPLSWTILPRSHLQEL
ncbi:MAG: hypothetical protein DBX04_08570 [Candidatus Poseidoniales archaeon]|nr:MAG: hypothetical protein DBX04_08570 [Candidatus Poseidoniales archaeon]